MPRRSLLPLTLLALLAQLVVLYLPGDDVPAAGFEIPGLDKAIHLVVFAVPTALALLLTRRWWPVLPLAVHAPVSEALQVALGHGRTGDAWDVAADLAGVALGAGAVAAGARFGRERADAYDL